MNSVLRRLALAPVVVLFAAVAQAAEPAIIAKARAFVGAEATLEAVTSVKFTGTLTAPDAKDPTKQVTTALEIIFQKPDQQRIMMTSNTEIETTGLDGYEGWLRRQDPNVATNWRQMLLGVEQIKRLRANAWENLYYFRGIERIGGRVEDQGTKQINGVTCQKIAFIHSSNIIFIRYFDVATGKLVLTETEGGGTIRETGEMMVNGVRFPRTIVTTAKSSKGEEQAVTVNFEKIELNQTFPGSIFRVPSPSAR
ncbi:MAG: hypothetical protein V4773_07940 [Verrucomicrobiota bacterium]